MEIKNDEKKSEISLKYNKKNDEEHDQHWNFPPPHFDI